MVYRGSGNETIANKDKMRLVTDCVQELHTFGEVVPPQSACNLQEGGREGEEGRERIKLCYVKVNVCLSPLSLVYQHCAQQT